MSRNHEKLHVFQLADELVGAVYKDTASFPMEERFGLQMQVRRAAVSAATNIVEGCARSSTREYLRFIDIALASAAEVEYLLGLSSRLGVRPATAPDTCRDSYKTLVRSLQKLLSSYSYRSP